MSSSTAATTDQPDDAPKPQPQQHDDGGQIVARPGQYYRNARYIITILLIGSGAWFAYDGWVKYPAQNAAIAQAEAELVEAQAAGDEARIVELSETLKQQPHTETDLLIQRVLGVALPPLGLVLLGYWLYRSRGTYRFENDTLHVPGHPPVRLDQITRIDKSQWDRKGIARIDYDGPGGGTGRIVLDDFVYDRRPTDAIFERIERYVTGDAGGSSDQPAEPAPSPPSS